MPTFEIPDGPTSVELKRSGDPGSPATGSVVFSVTNKLGDSSAGRLGVVPSDGAKQEWFTIDGDRERTFGAGETQTATIRISAPKDVPAGDYPFRLRVVSVNDPDNDHAEGPVATVKVPRIPVVNGGKPFPWLRWLIIALVALALLGTAAYFIFRPKPSAGPVASSGQYATFLAGQDGFSGDWPSGPMWVGSGQRVRVVHVNFTKPFEAEPKVVFGISTLDAESSPASSVRIAVSAENVTTRGFDLRFVTWADSRIATATVGWIAYKP